MRSRSLRFKIICSRFVAALVPVAVIGFLTMTKSSDALDKASRDQLAFNLNTALRQELKIAQAIAGVLAALAIILLSWQAQSITRPIKSVVDHINTGADQVITMGTSSDFDAF